MVVLYSTGCPKCNILKKKLSEAGIPYQENNSVDEMQSRGFMQLPMLDTGDSVLEFGSAIKWIVEQGGAR